MNNKNKTFESEAEWLRLVPKITIFQMLSGISLPHHFYIRIVSPSRNGEAFVSNWKAKCLDHLSSAWIGMKLCE